jgi:hypothetical protein
MTARAVDTDVNVSTVADMPPTVALPPPLSAPPLVPRDPSEFGVDGDAPASTLAGSVAADMGVLTAPSTGRFRALLRGGVAAAGTALGSVTGGAGRVDEIRVPVAAEICGLLALDGQLVQLGQVLAWVRLVERGGAR